MPYPRDDDGKVDQRTQHHPPVQCNLELGENVLSSVVPFLTVSLISFPGLHLS